MHSMPSEHMDESMDGYQTGSEQIREMQLALAMALTTVLKVFRG